MTGEFGELRGKWQPFVRRKEREIKGKKMINNRHRK